MNLIRPVGADLIPTMWGRLSSLRELAKDFLYFHAIALATHD